ncbi:MBL fold metallo-hydrolase [Myxococcus sp. CA039A]|uniref:MBL fold metallo-hydrolase n=1 Tax=Myxococcus sp. CA039A TaxID=2741737 RepID=UPI00157B48FB|nr:MBL fold metallo-hydrolase [Myxococcus sp. CA039A]NTX49978.1 MBL fold metallo-hydrolase [Myxococcus sp. CA039A]
MGLKTLRLAPEVWVVTGEAYDSNATLFLREGEVLMVDALASRADAEALREWVAGSLRARVRQVVCTHGFSDHLAGLQAFPEASVWAHARFEETFRLERFRSDEETGFYRAPDRCVDAPLSLEWGRYTLDVFPNPGHTASTLNLDVPALDVLLSADIAVGNMAYVAYGEPADIDAALARAEARGRTRVIQGHGGVSSARTLGAARHYLRALEAAVRETRGVPERVRAIPLGACLPEDVEGGDFEAFFHRRNLDEVLSRGLWSARASASPLGERTGRSG